MVWFPKDDISFYVNTKWLRMFMQKNNLVIRDKLDAIAVSSHLNLVPHMQGKAFTSSENIKARSNVKSGKTRKQFLVV